jgi:hypothetical protein
MRPGNISACEKHWHILLLLGHFVLTKGHNSNFIHTFLCYPESFGNYTCLSWRYMVGGEMDRFKFSKNIYKIIIPLLM